MITIALHDYPIYVGSCLDRIREWAAADRYSQVFVFVDSNTRQYCLPVLEPFLDAGRYTVVEIAAGEAHKNINTCQQIWNTLMYFQMDRSALVLNLGGGVLGDMGGFCASTFKRGVDFIQIPTTLLAQVDASIGGKLGIDYGQVKNSIGLFRNPRAVLADPVFFQTLPPRELRSGFAEVIKHSLIASREQWEHIVSITDLATVDWPTLVAPSLEIKRDIVAKDPFEKGLRKALNFGHTIGHALESHALETADPLLHGEAIAAGMICEAFLSHQKLGLPEAELDQISQFLVRMYQPGVVAEEQFDHLIALMQNDKKNRGSAINFSLLPTIGSVEVDQTCTPGQILESLRYLHACRS
jgi:3-dehydroquinate synthase